MDYNKTIWKMKWQCKEYRINGWEPIASQEYAAFSYSCLLFIVEGYPSPHRMPVPKFCFSLRTVLFSLYKTLSLFGHHLNHFQNHLYHFFQFFSLFLLGLNFSLPLFLSDFHQFLLTIKFWLYFSSQYHFFLLKSFYVKYQQRHYDFALLDRSSFLL
jgi:hypothetical protein